jgi:thymidylate synthase
MVAKLSNERIETETCGEAWIKALKFVYLYGTESFNHYEKEISKEATVMIVVTDPLKEPRLHRADLFGIQTIKKSKYIDEILEGVHDNYIEGAWDYTYHDRLFNWAFFRNKYKKRNKVFLKLYKQRFHGLIPWSVKSFNQFNKLIELISKPDANTNRKLQMTTWIPPTDLDDEIGSPCLQRIWFRIIEKDDKKGLIMNTHWRSRDLYKAWSSNVYAMIELGNVVAEKINAELVQYIDISDSLHIYGKDFPDIERIFETIKVREQKEKNS